MSSGGRGTPIQRVLVTQACTKAVLTQKQAFNPDTATISSNRHFFLELSVQHCEFYNKTLTMLLRIRGTVLWPRDADDEVLPWLPCGTALKAVPHEFEIPEA